VEMDKGDGGVGRGVSRKVVHQRLREEEESE